MWLLDGTFDLITYRKSDRDPIPREEFEKVRVKAGAGEEIEELTSRIRSLPARVKATELRRLPRQWRLVADAIKMVAYQVETDLHRLLIGRYCRAREEGRTLLQSMFRASARLELRDGELLVTIERLPQDHKTEVMRELCEEMTNWR